MYRHARNLEFEQAALLRDQLDELRKLELELGAGVAPTMICPVALARPRRQGGKP